MNRYEETFLPYNFRVPSAESRDVVYYLEVQPPGYDLSSREDAGWLHVVVKTPRDIRFLDNGALVVTDYVGNKHHFPGAWVGYASTHTEELRDAAEGYVTFYEPCD